MYVKNAGPDPEPGLVHEPALQTAAQKWSGVSAGNADLTSTDFTVEMMNIASFGL